LGGFNQRRGRATPRQLACNGGRFHPSVNYDTAMHVRRATGHLAQSAQSQAERQLMADLRSLMNDCLAGVRRQDPPSAWEPRLARIEELAARLDRLEVERQRRSGPDS
jgi:hypothetical protein